MVVDILVIEFKELANLNDQFHYADIVDFLQFFLEVIEKTHYIGTYYL